MAVNAAQIRWEIKRKTAPGEFELIDEGPGVDQLRRPNPFCTGRELREAMAGWLLGDGNCFVEKVRSNQGRVVELYVLDARRVKVVPDREKFIRGYLLEVSGSGERVRFEPEDIVHIKLFNLLSPWYGMTPLAAMRKVVQANVSADHWNEKFFENSAIPAGVLQSKEDQLPDAEVSRIRTAWDQAHRGVDKAWRTAITWGGLEYKPIAPTHSEMGFAELDDNSRDKILGILGVPRPHKENLNYATANITSRDFWTNTAIPIMERCAMKMTAQLLPEFAAAHGLDFERDPESAKVMVDTSQISALSEVLAEQEEAWNIGISNGSYLINEVREKRGQDPVPWGDTWHGPMTVVALATLSSKGGYGRVIRELAREGHLSPGTMRQIEQVAGADTGMSPEMALALVSGFTKQNGNGHKSLPMLLREGAGGSETRVEPSLDPGRSLPPAADDKMVPSLGNKDRRKIISKRFEAQLRPWERLLERPVRAVLNAQRDRIHSRLKEWESSRKQDDVTVTSNLTVELLFDTEEEAEAFVRSLTPHVTEVAADFGQGALDFLGIEQEYDATGNPLQEFISRRLRLMMRRTSDSLFGGLAELVTEATNDGSTVQDLAKAIREFYDVQSRVRAIRIARTEAGSAANFSIVDGWRQSGVVVGKEWISSRDGNVRDTHTDADGQVVRLGEQFIVGGHSCDHPMDLLLPADEQINCRCTSAPVIDEDELAERGGVCDPLFLTKNDVPLLKAA